MQNSPEGWPLDVELDDVSTPKRGQYFSFKLYVTTTRELTVSIKISVYIPGYGWSGWKEIYSGTLSGVKIIRQSYFVPEDSETGSVIIWISAFFSSNKDYTIMNGQTYYVSRDIVYVIGSLPDINIEKCQENYENLYNQYNSLYNKYKSLYDNYTLLLENYNNLQVSCNEWKNDYESLYNEYKSLYDNYTSLLTNYNNLIKYNEELKNDLNAANSMILNIIIICGIIIAALIGYIAYLEYNKIKKAPPPPPSRY